MEYPKKLHDNHNDLPLAPESLMINQVEKLVQNFPNKTKYVIQYRNLKVFKIWIKTNQNS